MTERKRAVRLDLDPSDFDELGRCLTAVFGADRQERMAVMGVSEGYRIVSLEIISAGSASSVEAVSGRVVEAIARSGCRTGILVHSHPSGVARFSEEDVRTTRVICREASAAGLSVIDHLLAARGTVISMLAEGLLDIRMK